MRTEPEAEPAEPPTAGGFEDLFRRLFPVVSRATALAVRDFDLGQDLAQESFTRLYARWDRMASQEHASNFAFKVAMNLAWSHLRREARRRALRLPVRPAPDEAEASADRLTLARALAGLTPRQRSCLALVDYAGMDVASAAQVLGMRASTVRVHLTRGRRELAAQLDKTYGKAGDDD